MRVQPDGPNGFALVLALLALMVLAGIVSAALAAGLGQVRAANKAGEVLARQSWARGSVDAVIQTARGWSTAVVGEGAIEVYRDSIGNYGNRRVLNLRIAPEFHVFIGEAAVGRGVPMRHIRVAWWPDPETRISGHRAVLEGQTVTISPGAQVRSASSLDDRPGVPGCGRSPILAEVFGGTVPLSGPLPQSPEWGAGTDVPDDAGLRLGNFSVSMLEEFADRRLPSGGSLTPLCTGCWSGLVFAIGSTELRGQGAGVLVVDGDLTLGSGSVWTGLLLASGEVTLTDGSGAVGLVRAGEALTVESGASVDGSACAAVEALRAAMSLARPLAMPGRSSAGPVAPAGVWQ